MSHFLALLGVRGIPLTVQAWMTAKLVMATNNDVVVNAKDLYLIFVVVDAYMTKDTEAEPEPSP